MSYPSDSLNFNELRRANEARSTAIDHPIDKWTPAEWALAAAGEMGETCNLIKKQLRGDVITVESIADELADTVTYIDLLAARLGIDLGEAVRSKFNVVSKRWGTEVKL